MSRHSIIKFTKPAEAAPDWYRGAASLITYRPLEPRAGTEILSITNNSGVYSRTGSSVVYNKFNTNNIQTIRFNDKNETYKLTPTILYISKEPSNSKFDVMLDNKNITSGVLDRYLGYIKLPPVPQRAHELEVINNDGSTQWYINNSEHKADKVVKKFAYKLLKGENLQFLVDNFVSGQPIKIELFTDRNLLSDTVIQAFVDQADNTTTTISDDYAINTREFVMKGNSSVKSQEVNIIANRSDKKTLNAYPFYYKILREDPHRAIILNIKLTKGLSAYVYVSQITDGSIMNIDVRKYDKERRTNSSNIDAIH